MVQAYPRSNFSVAGRAQNTHAIRDVAHDCFPDRVAETCDPFSGDRIGVLDCHPYRIVGEVRPVAFMIVLAVGGAIHEEVELQVVAFISFVDLIG